MELNNRIIDILLEISDRYGDMVFYNHQKTKNLMHDLAPGLHKERIHISQFLELNGYFQLKYAGHSYPIIRARLAQNYANTYGVHDNVAIWVLDVFSELLGYSDFKNLNKIVQQNLEEPQPVSDTNQLDEPPKIPTPTDLTPLLEEPAPAYKSRTDEKTDEAPKKRIRGVKGTRSLSPSVTVSKGVSRAFKTFNLATKIAADMHTVATMPDGSCRAVGPNDNGQCNVGMWKNIVSVVAGPHFTIGLQGDGNVVATGKNDWGQCNVRWWRDIVAISAGARHTVGLKADGTVVATGQNRNGECNVGAWRDVARISAGYLCTFGIKKNNTVLLKGNVKSSKPLEKVLDVINPYPHRALVLKRSGRLDVVEKDDVLLESIAKWRGLTQVSAGPDYFAGLFEDGTVKVLAYYWRSSGIESGPNSWTDIAAIAAGRFHLLGVKKDGSIVSTMMHPSRKMNKGQCKVDDWRVL